MKMVQTYMVVNYLIIKIYKISMLQHMEKYDQLMSTGLKFYCFLILIHDKPQKSQQPNVVL